VGANSTEDLGDSVPTTTVIPRARKKGKDGKELDLRLSMCRPHA